MASEVVERESPIRTRILTAVVVFLVVGLLGGITFAVVNGGDGSELTGEERAQIEQAKDCDELRALSAEYSPNKDSVDAAAEADRLIRKRLIAECVPAP